MYIELKTDRLLLRPFNIDDLEPVHEYAGDVEGLKYMMYLPNYTIDETKEFLTHVEKEWQKEEPSTYEFAIIFEDKLIGAVSIEYDKDNKQAELGWILNKTYQGKGIAFEAAMAVKEFAIGKLKITKLIAHCDSRNSPSYTLMEKLGMTLEDDTGTRQNRSSTEIVKELKYSLNI